ncbi:hypothetical protein PHMEG_00010182 [Phytophthora megakarya]|uniref:Uncharacterized protein n=1 Tax=Phytophthora megakarya TaxID=4795 RepID=A0A225WGD8_9STRA|nr:hypothetical protein PHMEG_00010182 [Phytophthora megakarya]
MKEIWTKYCRQSLHHLRTYTNNRVKFNFGKLNINLDSSSTMKECLESAMRSEGRMNLNKKVRWSGRPSIPQSETSKIRSASRIKCNLRMEKGTELSFGNADTVATVVEVHRRSFIEINDILSVIPVPHEEAASREKSPMIAASAPDQLIKASIFEGLGTAWAVKHDVSMTVVPEFKLKRKAKNVNCPGELVNTIRSSTTRYICMPIDSKATTGRQ